MTITATFDGFEDMAKFAAQLLGQTDEKPAGTEAQPHPATATPSVPVTPAAPTAPVAQIPPVAAAVTPGVMAAPTVPTSAPEYTMDDLARAAIPLRRWLTRYQALTGAEYIEYFNKRHWLTLRSFVLLVERKEINLWQFFEQHKGDGARAHPLELLEEYALKISSWHAENMDGTLKALQSLGQPA